MARPIDADALITAVLKNAIDYAVVFGDSEMHRLLVQVIAHQPTIDIEPHWIPCSERLPEDDRSKVVTLANGNAEVGYYSNGDWWCVGDKVTLENQTVIAWMPLPKPYEVNHE